MWGAKKVEQIIVPLWCCKRGVRWHKVPGVVISVPGERKVRCEVL